MNIDGGFSREALGSLLGKIENQAAFLRYFQERNGGQLPTFAELEKTAADLKELSGKLDNLVLQLRRDGRNA